MVGNAMVAIANPKVPDRPQGPSGRGYRQHAGRGGYELPFVTSAAEPNARSAVTGSSTNSMTGTGPGATPRC